MDNTKTIDLYAMLGPVVRGIEKTIKKTSRERMTATHKVATKWIVTWEGKMRIFDLEKFHTSAFVSAVHYYLDEEMRKQSLPFGAAVLYIEMSEAYAILSGLGIEMKCKYVENDDEISEENKSVAGSCGELCGILADTIRREIIGVGYPDLLVSAPSNYFIELPLGIPYPATETNRYELFFQLKRKGEELVEGEDICLDLVLPLVF